MASIADLNVRIGLIYKDLDKGLERVERNLRASGRRLSALGSDLTVAISAPLGLIGASAIKAAGDMESLQLALRSTFETAGRSIAAADRELENLRKSALAPGLDFEQAVKASIRLQGVEYSAESARKTIEGVANAVALTGGTSANLESVTVQFSQMISKGKVLSQDLRIIQENMPIISKLMKQAFGTSNAEDIQNLGITGRQFVDRITKEMEKLPRVSGGISNALVNAGTAVKQFLAGIGFEINKAFDLTGKSDRFSAFLQDIAKSFAGLDDGVKRSIIEFGLFAVAIGPAVKVLGVLQSGIAQTIGIAQSLIAATKPLALVFTAMTESTAGVIPFFRDFTKQLASTGEAAVAMRLRIAAATLGLVGILGAVAFAAYALSQRFDAAKFASEKFAEAQSGVTSETAKGIAVLDKNIEVLKSSNSTSAERKAAIDELLKQYPSYLKGIDLEKASVSELTGIHEKLVDQIQRGVAERKKAEAINSIYEKRGEILLRIQKIREGEKPTISESTLIDTGDLVKAGSISAAVIEKLQGQADGLVKEAKTLGEQFDRTFNIVGAGARRASPASQVLSDLKTQTEENTNATKEHEKAVKAAEKAARERAKADKESAKELSEIIDQLLLLNELDEAAKERNKTPVIPLGGEKNATFGQPNLAPVTSQKTGKDRALEIGDAIASISVAAQEGLSPIDQLIDAIDSKLLTFSESWTELSKTVTDGSGVMGDALATAASAFVTTAASGEASFKSLGQAALQGAAGVVRAKLLESVASVAADAFKKFGILGFIGAAVAGGAVVGLFNKLVSSIKLPGFAQGTDFAPGGLALVGERGPELINLPRGSQVIPNPRLGQLAGGASVQVGGTFRIQGTDLVVVLERAQQEAKRIRGF